MARWRGGAEARSGCGERACMWPWAGSECSDARRTPARLIAGPPRGESAASAGGNKRLHATTMHESHETTHNIHRRQNRRTPEQRRAHLYAAHAPAGPHLQRTVFDIDLLRRSRRVTPVCSSCSPAAPPGSSASRLHLGCISAVSRLYLGSGERGVERVCDARQYVLGGFGFGFGLGLGFGLGFGLGLGLRIGVGVP